MLRARVIVLAEPSHKRFYVPIPPHPNRETGKPRERPAGSWIVTATAHVLVYAMGIGPVSFGRNRLESFLNDQALRDRGSRGIELVGSVSSFTEEHKPGVAGKIDQRVEIGAAAL